MATKKAATKQTEINLRPLSMDTIDAFQAFLVALSKDNTFDPSASNDIREGAAEFDADRIVPALGNIAKAACRDIQMREARLKSFGETASSEAHKIFSLIGRNSMAVGELMAWLAQSYEIHLTKVSEYRTRLDEVLADDERFKVVDGSVYRMRDEEDNETGVALPGAPKKRGRKPKSETNGVSAPKDPTAFARGRDLPKVKIGLGVSDSEKVTNAMADAFRAQFRTMYDNKSPMNGSRAELEAAGKAVRSTIKSLRDN